MLEELDGRVAVVTGAASGIGLAMSEAFLAEGMQVVLSDRDEATLDAQVERLANVGGSFLGILSRRWRGPLGSVELPEE
mgnify:CR=1 FL=1